MTIRRGARPAQVRPRPASTGRPAAATRPRRRTGRISPRRPAGRRSGLPLVARLGLLVGVVALGFVVLAAASGLVTRAVSGLGGAMSAAVARLTPTDAPSAGPVVPIGAPVLEAPAEPYTNQATVDVSGSIPGSAVGQAGTKVRLYLSLGNAKPAPIAEQPVGGSVAFTFPAVQLTEGTNRLSATLVRGTTESDQSAPVTYVLDTKAPPLTLTAPANGVTINRAAVTVTGRTQARSDILVRNTDAGVTAIGTAGGDGSFSVSIALAAGTNGITVTATDPAGNTKSTVLSVRRGNGVLTASIRASRYRFPAKSLPDPLTLSVSVLDPDAKPLEGAAVTFTISIPGVPTITAQATTDATGRATFSTTIPKGATAGSGPAAVLVTTDQFGQATDRTVITITP